MPQPSLARSPTNPTPVCGPHKQQLTTGHFSERCREGPGQQYLMRRTYLFRSYCKSNFSIKEGWLFPLITRYLGFPVSLKALTWSQGELVLDVKLN